ncbi:MAG TPA: type I methionyl aminopeptidase [Candidatus Paceibacterota bacterium]|nr:type I methionyl aminopeptidase [Candidatus Paceibacterota bacterium]
MNRLIKTPADIVLLRESGKRLSSIVSKVAAAVAPGVTTGELDALARREIAVLGDKPAFLNYRPQGAPKPYPAALCVSVNEEIVHGIPGERILEEGDIVTVDLGLNHQGRFTDMALTVPVGAVEASLLPFLDACKRSLEAGIAAAKPGNRIGDISAAVSQTVKAAGYVVIRELAGHGVGYGVHEDPYVPNYGPAGKGMKLEPGMVIAIEPMIALSGKGNIVLEDDDFTYATEDGSLSAHFEHTVLIGETGPEVLTALAD